jgi:hypothetical protein
MNPSAVAARGRNSSSGFYFVHSRHEQDLRKREAMNRVLRDLEHNRHRPPELIAICRPILIPRKCPKASRLVSKLREELAARLFLILI